MEFLKANFLNTTTQLTVNSNTGTAANIFARDPYAQYYSDGLNDDATTCSITITFDQTISVNRIAIIDTNAEEFTVFYNGSTANTFALTTTSSTIASAWLSNTSENIYMRCADVWCSSITLNIKTTQTADQEKRVGIFYAGDTYYTLTQLPNASDYTPALNPKQIVHTLSDGGTRIHNIRNKWSVNIGLDYITQDAKDNLYDLWALQDEFVFCPFGTSTSWDGYFFEAVWTGPFDFYKYSDNAPNSGYSGQIRLKETPV